MAASTSLNHDYMTKVGELADWLRGISEENNWVTYRDTNSSIVENVKHCIHDDRLLKTKFLVDTMEPVSGGETLPTTAANLHHRALKGTYFAFEVGFKALFCRRVVSTFRHGLHLLSPTRTRQSMAIRLKLAGCTTSRNILFYASTKTTPSTSTQCLLQILHNSEKFQYAFLYYDRPRGIIAAPLVKKKVTSALASGPLVKNSPALSIAFFGCEVASGRVAGRGHLAPRSLLAPLS